MSKKIFTKTFYATMLMFLAVMFLFGSMLMVGCDDDDDDDTTPPDDGDYTDSCGGTIVCDNNICQVTGRFCDEITWTSDNLYILNGGVLIGNDSASVQNTLTIQAGTEIHGLNTTPPGMLVITRHANINAVGTADNPIVFTSDAPVGQRARKDWGGVIINGLAQINTCWPSTPPCEAQGEGASGLYGGNDDADNSGTMKYVRIEFAGHDFSSDDELNGLALQGVGSGTTLEYIQVHMNKDDGIEFFGGNAHVKHLLITGCADDSLDWTFGWRGKAQYFIVQHYSDDADQGIEADNNGDTDDDALPRSMPMLANGTLVGSPNSESSDTGTLFREGTGVRMYSTIVTGFNDSGLDIDDDATWMNAYTDETFSALSGNLMLTDCVYYNAVNFKDDDEIYLDSQFFNDCGTNMETDPGLMDPFNQTSPNFMPAATLNNTIDPHSVDSWFDSTNYIGAMPAGGADWIAGWTTSAQN